MLAPVTRNTQEALDPWPADPIEQLALADALDARARATAFRAELLRDRDDQTTLRASARDLRKLAVQLRDAAWRQVGA